MRKTTEKDRPLRLLFVCTAGMQRSPTAAGLFEGAEHYEARYGGASPFAMGPVTQEKIDWVDVIFVMSEKEEAHGTYLRQNFDIGDTPIYPHTFTKSHACKGVGVYELDIQDRYPKGSEELKALLRERISDYIDVDWENL